MASVELFGQSFRLADKPHKYALTKFLALAQSSKGKDMDEGAASAAIMSLLEKSLHPDDWDRFDALCMEHDPDIEGALLPLVAAVYQQATDRPTQQPSGSSDGLPNTAARSMDDSYLQAMRQQEEAGRPDNALMILKAHRSRTLQVA